MTIRSKLTYLFTGLFAALLVVFALIIYVASATARKDAYYQQLKQQAITKVSLLMDAKVSPEVLQLIYKNSSNSLFEEEVAIYDTSFHLLYHDAVQVDKVKETRGMIDSIVRQQEIRFTQGKLQAVGILYPYKGTNYIVTAAAEDVYGYGKLQALRLTLIISLISSLLLTIFFGRFFARQALQPVADMVSDVNKITATNLDSRLAVKNSQDEMGELANTFNNMLNRLENSFDAQKNFVSNVSHEIRTPLATMIADLELTGNKEQTNDAYKQVIARVMKDAQRLTKLSNGLLDMAKASYDQSEIGMQPVRLDELLIDAREMVIKNNPGFTIHILFEQEIENDAFISVQGNPYLLKLAFINLMENACKFSSNHRCDVAIAYTTGQVLLRFTDTGIGIPDTDQAAVFNPFYRGANSQYAEGHGIGLSLTQKIVLLHKGAISLVSQAGKGSTFTMQLPHL
jgi:signal transduction histidine kinase